MKKLTRSRSNKIIFGVCGGIAEYLNIDATLIRVAWFLLTLPMLGSLGLAYLVCGFIIPEDDGFIYPEGNNSNPINNNNAPILFGIGLIVFGGYHLIKIIFPQILNFSRYWPILLIILGIYILISSKKDK